MTILNFHCLAVCQYFRIKELLPEMAAKQKTVTILSYPLNQPKLCCNILL